MGRMEILRSYTYLQSIIYKSACHFLMFPEGSLAIPGRDIVRGGPALEFVVNIVSPSDDIIIPVISPL
jgi:hypothetical protein